MSRRARQPDFDPSQQQLYEAIEQNYEYLVGAIRNLLIQSLKRCNLTVNGKVLQTLIEEILSETVKTAARKAHEFDPNASPRAWLRAFAGYKVLEWQRQQFQDRKVTSIADIPKIRKIEQLRSSSGGTLTEDEMLSLVIDRGEAADPYGPLILDELLSLVKDEDSKVLRLAFIDGLKGQSLAAVLGISEAAAWARLSRAITRLRKAYAEDGRGLEGGR